MTYLQFNDDEHTILVEVTPADVQARPGVVKAGVADRINDGLVKAQTSLQAAFGALLEQTAGSFVQAVRRLEDPPDNIELQFSVKATGELGNLAIGKLSGESNYAVKLTWTRPLP
ncbi:CU044_2847 family protein [Monashia sp. NPDC004114]